MKTRKKTKQIDKAVARVGEEARVGEDARMGEEARAMSERQDERATLAVRADDAQGAKTCSGNSRRRTTVPQS